MKRLCTPLCVLLILGSLNACTTVSRTVNPFYKTPSKVALLGEPNDHALNGDKQKEENVRDALDALGKYQAAHNPAPYKPVYQPAIIRLMWIPPMLISTATLRANIITTLR